MGGYSYGTGLLPDPGAFADADRQAQVDQQQRLFRLSQGSQYGGTVPPAGTPASIDPPMMVPPTPTPTPAPGRIDIPVMDSPAALTPQSFEANRQRLGLPSSSAPSQAPPRNIDIPRDGMTSSIRRGAYQEQTPMPLGMVDGPGGPAIVGSQLRRDTAGEQRRRGDYSDTIRQMEEIAKQNDPRRRALEAQQLDAMYEMTARPQRPLTGEGGTFTKGKDGTYRNNIDLPRYDRGAVAQKQAESFVNKDAGKLSGYDEMIDSATRRELEAARQDPAYVRSTPERRAAYEAHVMRQAEERKAQARLLGLTGNFPSAGSSFGGAL